MFIDSRPGCAGVCPVGGGAEALDSNLGSLEPPARLPVAAEPATLAGRRPVRASSSRAPPEGSPGASRSRVRAFGPLLAWLASGESAGTQRQAQGMLGGKPVK